MDPTNHIFYQGEYQGRHFFCITVEDRMQQVRRAEREELEHMLTYDHTLSPRYNKPCAWLLKAGCAA